MSSSNKTEETEEGIWKAARGGSGREKCVAILRLCPNIFMNCIQIAGRSVFGMQRRNFCKFGKNIHFNSRKKLNQNLGSKTCLNL